MTNQGNNTIQTVNLNDGGSIIVSTELIKLPEVSRTFFAWGNNVVTEQYVIRHALYPDTKLVLKSYFNVNNNNINMYDVSTAGTSALFQFSVDERNTRITQKVASSKGQIIGAASDYKFAVGINGQGIGARTYQIRSQLKLDYIGTHGAQIHVVHWID